MSTSTPERDVRYGWVRNANDVFKARWDTRLHWSITAAAAAHAVLFFWSPSWDWTKPLPEPVSNRAGMELVSLIDGASPAGGVLPATVVVSDDPTPMPDEPDPEEGTGLSEWELAGLSDALREELSRRAFPVPTIVEPQPESDPPTAVEDAEAADGERTRIGGHYSLSDYESLTEDEVLALERLSALHPELAFVSPSSSILIRNPSDVIDFLGERFGRPELGAGPPGWLSVAIWVDDLGSVEWAEIARSSGHPNVDESALELFTEVISFRPARKGGVRVPMAMIFSLQYPW